MNKFYALFAASLLCAAAVRAGEDEGEDGPDMRPVVFIDAAAIENKTDNRRANFAGLIDRLDNALVRTGVYRVINSKALTAGLKEDEFFAVVADDGGKASKVETPAMKVYMTVMQYGVAASSGKDMYGNVSSVRQAKIELILKVVDMRTKETIKSENISRSANGVAAASANLDEQVLQQACQQVANDIVDALVKLTPFNVLDVDGSEVLVDVPGQRVKVGQQIIVKKRGKKVRSKRTGKAMVKESVVATIGVAAIGEDSVTCKLLSGAIEPDADADEGCEYDKYVIRLDETSVAPAAPVAVPAVSAPAAGSAANPF